MRYLVISDVHDNLSALEQVLCFYAKYNCQGLIILGDICTFQEDFRTLLKPYLNNLILIKGNNDSILTEQILGRPLLKDYYLVNGKCLFYLTHGEYLRLDGDVNIKTNAYILFGHYHIPLIKTINKRLYLNPGSVSRDRSGLGASFMILDDEVVTCFKLDGTFLFNYSF